MSNCSRRRQCSVIENGKQCPSFHHPLLHQSTKANVGVALTKENQETLLPIISTKICSPKKLYKRENVLFDSGAQISLIKQETAESLGLKGKDASITITKVGGEEENVKRKVYKVPVTSLGTRKTYSVTAVGIVCISDNVTDVKIDKIAGSLRQTRSQIYRGKGSIDCVDRHRPCIYAYWGDETNRIFSCKKFATWMGSLWIRAWRNEQDSQDISR